MKSSAKIQDLLDEYLFTSLVLSRHAGKPVIWAHRKWLRRHVLSLLSTSVQGSQELFPTNMDVSTDDSDLLDNSDAILELISQFDMDDQTTSWRASISKRNNYHAWAFIISRIQPVQCKISAVDASEASVDSHEHTSEISKISQLEVQSQISAIEACLEMVERFNKRVMADHSAWSFRRWAVSCLLRLHCSSESNLSSKWLDDQLDSLTSMLALVRDNSRSSAAHSEGTPSRYYGYGTSLWMFYNFIAGQHALNQSDAVKLEFIRRHGNVDEQKLLVQRIKGFKRPN